MCQTGRFWDLIFRAQRWIRFSKYVTPLGKMREVIVIWHVRNKNLLHVFKMIFQPFRIVIWKWWLNMLYFCLLQVKTQHHLAGFDLIYPLWSWYLGVRIFGIELRNKPCFIPLISSSMWPLYMSTALMTMIDNTYCIFTLECSAMAFHAHMDVALTPMIDI